MKLRIVWMALLLSSCRSDAPKDEPPTIEKVSQEITFDSVARLGPHYAVSSIQHTERRSGEEVHRSTESTDIAWNSWDSFHIQRSLDGAATFEVIVHDGSYASRNGRGPWTAEMDGESSRLEVYTTWNVWDEALGSFKDRILYEEIGNTVVDGRDTRHFRISLAPEDKKKSKAQGRASMKPVKIEGDVHLDAQTAVRLSAKVTAISRQGSLERGIQLEIQRSRIGQAQPIEAPSVQIGTAGDLLKKMPKRRSGRGPDPSKLR